MGPEDGHAPPAKSNSGRGQEWGGSRAEEPGLKSLPTGLPVPPRPAPARGGWRRGGSSPANTRHRAGGSHSCPPLPGLPCLRHPCCQHQQGTTDVAPAQPRGQCPGKARVSAGTGPAPWARQGTLEPHPCPHCKPDLPPLFLGPSASAASASHITSPGSSPVPGPVPRPMPGSQSPCHCTRREQCPVPQHSHTGRCHLL